MALQVAQLAPHGTHGSLLVVVAEKGAVEPGFAAKPNPEAQVKHLSGHPKVVAVPLANELLVS